MLMLYVAVLILLNCLMPIWKGMELGGKWSSDVYGLFFMASVLWPMYLMAGIGYAGYRYGLSPPLQYLFGQMEKAGKRLKDKKSDKQQADRYLEEAEVEVELLLRGRE